MSPTLGRIGLVDGLEAGLVGSYSPLGSCPFNARDGSPMFRSALSDLRELRPCTT